MRCHGLSAIEQLQATVESIQQEMTWLGQDLERNVSALATEASELSSEIAADSRAALAADTGSDDALQPESSIQTKCLTEQSPAAAEESPQCRGVCADMISNEPSAAMTEDLENSTQTAQCYSTAKEHDARDEDSDLQEMLARYPVAPEKLKQQVQEAFKAIHQQHQQQLQQLAATAANQGGAAPTKYGELLHASGMLCTAQLAEFCSIQQHPCLTAAVLLYVRRTKYSKIFF